MSDVPPDNPARKRGPLRTIVVVAAAVVSALVVLYLPMITFVARPYLIPSESMAPTLNPGDRVMVNKFKYHLGPPQPGDVIVFTAPPEWSLGYQSIRSDNTAVRWLQNALSAFGLVPPDENQAVKRIIAVGGQTVESFGHGTHGGRQAGQRAVSGPGHDVGRSADLPVPGPRVRPGRGAPRPTLGDGRQPHALGRLTLHCTNTPADFQRGLSCSGDPMAGTIPVDNVIGEVTDR